MTGEIRLMDMNLALSQYGISSFKSNHKVIRSIDLDNQVVFGGFEKSASIDTSREALTALFYCSPITITELPKGQTGALNLASMWLKAKADMEISPASCQKAINNIKARSGLTNGAIMAHYQDSIRKEIIRLGKQYLSGQYSNHDIENGLLMPVYNYYLNPSPVNLSSIASKARNAKSPGTYMLVLSGLSGRLFAEVGKKL